MSTVLLMTDTWHPTVLRLVPFTSNNAKVSERKTNGHQSSQRGFPVLAVTRNGNKNNSASSNERRSAKSASTRSVQSARSDYYTERDNGSEISAYTTPVRAMTDRSEDYVTKHRKSTKYPQKKIPVTHSEMKEAIKFSVQDLNDQVSSSSSMHSTEDSDKEKVQKVDNTRTSLPKPSSGSPQDAKYFSPPNGVRRSVPLTPGEMELQKFRDNCMLEQIKGRKKYKLNVNQIPRSTTPINDHDPDKLNMKQVIAFLQTKTPKDNSVRRSAGERKSETYRSHTIPYGTSGVSTITVRQKSEEEEHHMHGRSSVETRITDQTDNTRQTNGRVSVLSTKSTPNLPYGQSRKNDKNPGTMSVRSYGNRSKDTKDSRSRKPVKEFKLYRFLAIAPEGEKRQGLTTAVTESIPNVDVTSLEYMVQKNQSLDSPRKFLRKRGRETTTANLIHRRAVGNRNGSLPNMPHTNPQPEVAIRLPSMGDSPDEDSETCSTTSATYNSTKNGSNENIRVPKRERSISFLDEKQPAKCETNEDDNDNSSFTGNHIQSIHVSSFQPKLFKAPEFPKVSIPAPRQIHVNMPQENKKGYSQEIVRLTLRQEKSTTRVNSYMSDIQSHPPNKWHELEKSELLENSKLDSREWDLNTAKHMMNSIGNNNFIKVRQKLKTSNLST